MAGSSPDVTDQKGAEEALRDADRRKDEFLAILSHELRNPLAPIRNSLYVLERTEPGGEQARRAHAVIGRQVAHLARLVDDLLDVTRIARGKVQLQRQPLELRELVGRTIEDHRALFAARGIALDASSTTAPLWVNADATRIAQVVGNLLQNAAKFTPEGGRVEAALATGEGQAVVRVTDNGTGIAPEMLDRVFAPFTQAEATLDRSRDGLGLGLALVKGLVELHGGTVDAMSEGLGRGAAFAVRLPLQPAPSAAGVGAAPSSVAPRRRVLIIEDHPDAADSLREVFELDGHEVAVALSGPEGIEKARAFRPEVVLCDVGLPGMDGYAIARALRADEDLRDVLLIALTGYALPEDIAKAREAGFDHHVPKPPSIDKLEQALASAARDRGPR
jgi:two-component system CheB/CheR fusion protein